ncbi:hypothetical protein Tco_1054326 [Tanacetum coccineum]|uniref:Reverse transcriptase domain-containing protein n=1 Tax=Tanacetum coccineum TaxID=301880 RepID=A0ABQ5GXC7_9ASTR
MQRCLRTIQQRSLARGFSDRFSLESSGTSDTHRQTYSASKSQRTPSKNKEPTHLRRSRRLEDQSITKEKARRERSKSRRKMFRHQETSLDSEHEEGSEDAYEDLNSPYKRPKPTFLPKESLVSNIIGGQNSLGTSRQLRGTKSEVPGRIFATKKGVPPVLRISAFMHGHSHSELAKKFNDKIPKTVDEMLERVRDFIRGEVVAGSAEMVRPPQGD